MVLKYGNEELYVNIIQNFYTDIKVIKDITFNKYFLRVQKDGLYGITDLDGNIIINIEYEWIQLENNKNDFFIVNGNIILKKNGFRKVLNIYTLNGSDIIFDSVSDFKEGIAKSIKNNKDFVLIYEKNGNFNYINIGDKKDYHFFYEKLNNNFLIITKLDYKKVLIDYNGNIIKNIEFDYIGSYNDNLLIVGNNNYYGLIDYNGKIIADVIYRKDFIYYEDNIFILEIKNRQLIKSNKKCIIYNDYSLSDYIYDEIVYFNEKIAFVKNNNLYGIIDIEKKENLSEIIYEEIYIKYGYILIKKNGKIGLFYNDKIILDIIYDNIVIYDNIAIIIKDGKQGLYELEKNKIILDVIYDSIDIDNNTIIIKDNLLFNFIKLNNFEFFLNGIEKYSIVNNYCIFEKNFKMGIFDIINNKIIINLEYNYIKIINEEVILISNNGIYSLIKIDNLEIIIDNIDFEIGKYDLSDNKGNFKFLYSYKKNNLYGIFHKSNILTENIYEKIIYNPGKDIPQMIHIASHFETSDFYYEIGTIYGEIKGIKKDLSYLGYIEYKNYFYKENINNHINLINFDYLLKKQDIINYGIYDISGNLYNNGIYDEIIKNGNKLLCRRGKNIVKEIVLN